MHKVTLVTALPKPAVALPTWLKWLSAAELRKAMQQAQELSATTAETIVLLVLPEQLAQLPQRLVYSVACFCPASLPEAEQLQLAQLYPHCLLLPEPTTAAGWLPLLHLNRPAAAPPSHLFYRVKNRHERIDTADILWVQASDMYAIIRTANARYLVGHTLKALEAHYHLPQFLRIHRSYLVQLQAVTAFKEQTVFIGNEGLPVGATYRKELLAHLPLA
jgi:DNA-binding LytR/AlgR family response regulator